MTADDDLFQPSTRGPRPTQMGSVRQQHLENDLRERAERDAEWIERIRKRRWLLTYGAGLMLALPYVALMSPKAAIVHFPGGWFSLAGLAVIGGLASAAVTWVCLWRRWGPFAMMTLYAVVLIPLNYISGAWDFLGMLLYFFCLLWSFLVGTWAEIEGD